VIYAEFLPYADEVLWIGAAQSSRITPDWANNNRTWWWA